MISESTLPSASVFLVALAVWCLLLNAPLLGQSIDDQPRRFQSIDGLRGLLAIAVFSHHFALTAQWQHTHLWTATQSPIWNAMGHASVSLFFMITGFLFFRKISRPASRFDLFDFAKGRVLRIYPVYLVCLCSTALLALNLPDQSVSPADAIKSVVSWLLFCPGKLFGMQDAGLVVAYAPWSLRYELCFYVVLPVLAWAWRCIAYHPAFIIILAAASVLLLLWPVQFGHRSFQLESRYLAPFIFGGMATLFAQNKTLLHWFGNAAGSLIAGCAVVAICSRVDPYSLASYLILTAAFVPIVAGATFFGLLTSRPMLMLGAVSYDIYILHGLVLFVVFHFMAPTFFINLPIYMFLLALICVGMMVIGLSIVAHYLVEKPAMKLFLRRQRVELGGRLAT